MPDLRVDDFSAGKTDNYVNGPLNAAKEIDNFLLTKNRKPFVRYGSELYDSDLYQIPAGVARIGYLKYFEDVLFEQTSRSLYYREGGAWKHLRGPVDNNLAYGAGDTTNFVAMDEWKGHVYTTTDAYSTPRKFFHDGTGWEVRTAGMPPLASSPTVTPEAANGKSYIYYFYYSYTYSVGTVTHIDSGPVTAVQVTNAGDFSTAANGNDISVIPAISNGSTECYDTATLVCKIYRTVDGGSIGYYVGEVTNGTTTFEDDVSDASLGSAIYITGGVYDFDPPPQAKYVVVANNIAWYMNIKDGSEEQTFRVRQSLQNDLDACPASFFTDVDGEITGGSNVDIYPIVFTKNKTYRLEGIVDALGRGVTNVRVVSDTIGCVSNNGIVRMAYGLYFPARDGFYFTDGYRVQKLSDHLNESYKGLVSTTAQQKKIFGKRDRNTGRIYWTVQTNSADTECDAIWVLDPYWGLKNESTFTTWSHGDELKPTSLEFIDDELVRADSRGYSLVHKDTVYTDPHIDTSAATPADWYTKAVPYEYESCAFAFGTETQRKYITKLLTIARNTTNLSLLPQSINDDSALEKDLKEVRFRDNVTWGDEDLVWGDPDLIWNFTGVIIGSRRYPKNTLRCTYKQVKYVPSNTVIFKSDDYGTGTVAAAARTVTLDDAATEDWPTDLLAYNIFFADDSYTRGYQIEERVSADVIKVFDPGLNLTDGSKAWQIMGSKKDERFHLEAYTIEYNIFGESHTHYRTGDDGANA